MLPCVKSYFGKMSSSNFRRMVKDRLGLPKDQTIVFNVHRFATNLSGTGSLFNIVMYFIHREDKAKSATDRKNMNKLTV